MLYILIFIYVLFYMMDITLHLYNVFSYFQLDGTTKELFSIGQVRTEPCILPVTRGDKHEILILNDEKQVSHNIIYTYTCITNIIFTYIYNLFIFIINFNFYQISLDSEAKPTQPAALIWSDLPICIEHVHPYIIGVLPK